MALSGKKVAQIKIKSDIDVFHELWKANPHQIPSLTPTYIQNYKTHAGEVGTVGAVLFWNLFYDGKDRVAKTLITEINDSKKSISFKVLEGDVMELYKTFDIHIQVDTDGSNNLVTWTVEYVKLSPDVPDPDTLMEFYKNLTKDIETQHLKT